MTPHPEELERAVKVLRRESENLRVSIAVATKPDVVNHHARTRAAIDSVLAALSTEGAQERCPRCGSDDPTTRYEECDDGSWEPPSEVLPNVNPCPDPFHDPAPEQPQGEGEQCEQRIPRGLLDDLAARAARRLAPREVNKASRRRAE